MVSVDYGILPRRPVPYGIYGDHAYPSSDHPRDVHRRRSNRRGLAEIVGTVILVAIVVAAAAAFSLFVATYQSQLQKEETATHDRSLESIRILSIAVTTPFNLVVTLASSDVNSMNMSAYSLDGFIVPTWSILHQGALNWTTACASPGSDSCDIIGPLKQASVNLTSDTGLGITYPITLGILTERQNDFRFTFVPPVAIAKVYFVQTGAGITSPVFDGSGSFQPTGGDNTSIANYSWTFTAANLSVIRASGEQVEMTKLTTAGNPYSITLLVTNTDGLSGFVTIPYSAP